MANTLPINIPIPNESAVASYSWTDIASGLGYVNYYGLASVDSSATSYNLVNFVSYSAQKVETSKANGTETMSFDTSTFAVPRVAKGTAYFLCSLYVTGGNEDGSVQVTIQKVPVGGGAATSISSAVASPAYQGTAVKYVIFLKIPLTQTTIAIGEKLRMKVELIKSGASLAAVGHDPMNRDGTLIVPSTDNPETTTRMILYMPFKIDL